MDKETKKEIDELKKRIKKLEDERIVIVREHYSFPVYPQNPPVHPTPYNPFPYNPPITFC